ncbi:Phytochrome, two-component sensor histidine kinase [Anaerovibrio sp. JC8]|uniref:PAS domain-containing hybrid sensor histidine kinase/response regulator n=1 Tax=Anaerovibrio sp. JC8 TaxID=1240085 RepID=UPI000A0AD182|nr:PAS domain-containing protein [Anaerovibrio sp. JC8]ORT99327.1 Phytochrome, two-component sensor histidine kinase [Anaerovibrio sp. JC8]
MKDVSSNKIKLRSGTWYEELDDNARMKNIVFSDEIRQMLGYEDTDEYPDKLESLLELIHPEDKERTLAEAIAASTGQTEVFDTEFRVKNKDGGYMMVNATGKVIRNKAGKPVIMHGSIIDITELVENRMLFEQVTQRLEATQKRENDLRWFGPVSAIYETAKFRLEYDENGKRTAVTWNAAYRKLLGYETDEEFPQNLQTFYNHIVAEDLENVGHAMDMMEASDVDDSVHDVEFRMYKKDRSIVWVRAAARRILGPDGKAKQAIGLLTDITPQKNLELQKTIYEVFSQEFLTVGIIDIFHNQIWILRDKMINDTFIKSFEKGAHNYDNFLKEYVSKHVAEEERDRVYRASRIYHIVMQLKEKDVYRIRYKLVAEDGRIHHIQGSYLWLDNAGDKRKVICGFRDITDLIRGEQEKQEKLRKAQEEAEAARYEAEAASQAKTSFLFNMSHDIRTPMNAITGFRELLSQNQDNPEKRQYYLDKMDDACKVLISIINNVLEMARIEKGVLKLDETLWNTDQFNDGLYSVLKPMMDQKHIVFTQEMVVQHQYFYCDAPKLRDIFLNILSNSYKYTNPGGAVHMKLEEYPHEKPGWAWYRSTISDTGIGMSEEFIPHIFESFTRENNTTSNKIEGTGLGMSIVKRLTEFLGGKITVKSKKGEGTTFILDIPHRLGQKPEEGYVTEGHKDVDYSIFIGKRVLLAEDNEINAEIAIEILSSMGITVENAKDGKECVKMLELAEDNYYDLILMDVQMPNMNGYEATRAIRALPDKTRANIPILAMTANAFEEDKKEAFKSGMNGHLAKPIDVRELMRGMAKVLD